MKLEGRGYWRSQGLCIECGGSIDNPKKYIRCVACRNKKADHTACEQCGKPIDYPKYYRKCKKCRGESDKTKKTNDTTIETKPYHEVKKIIREEAKKISREERQAQFDKCLHCVWGNPIDGTVICAFPYCVF